MSIFDVDKYEVEFEGSTFIVYDDRDGVSLAARGNAVEGGNDKIGMTLGKIFDELSKEFGIHYIATTILNGKQVA